MPSRSLRRRLRRALAGILALSFAGCARNPAPRGVLLKPVDSQRDAFGGWIRVECTEGSGTACAEGELIAVSPDRLFVLGQQGFAEVPVGSVRKAVLTGYQTDEGTIGGWAAAGTLSALSHGYIAVFSLPIWLLASILATNSEVHHAQLVYPKTPLDSFRPYARFPQGLSPDLDPKALIRRKLAGEVDR